MYFLRSIKTQITILTILALLQSKSFAEEIKVLPIKTGETAAFDGFLVKPSILEDARYNIEKNKLMEKKVNKLETLYEIKSEQVDEYKKIAEEYRQESVKKDIKSGLTGIGGFVLGVALSTLAAYATIRTLEK